MSSKDDEVNWDYQSPKGTKLRFGSYWRWESADYPVKYFRLVTIQDSAGGLHAIVATEDSDGAGLHLESFDHEDFVEVTDEDEIALAMLVIHG